MFLVVSLNSIAQNKAIVLQSLWNNDLNNFNPKEFFDELYEVLKSKLAVKELTIDAKSLTGAPKDQTWEKSVREQVKAKQAAGENTLMVVLATELRLPTFNLGKFLFKNPPRSSKLTFTLHVYDTSGIEVMGDTIINRGCTVRTFDETKGARFFYFDYADFISDMKCHLEYIARVLQEKPISKGLKQYPKVR